MTRIRIAPEVAAALEGGGPVVALESTIISHGLPRPSNLRVAREIEATVRAHGAVPATIAMLEGVVHIGLTDGELIAIAERTDVEKVSVRDLGPVAARGGTGATTVAATSHLASGVGIRVFATGGLGGVHRGARDTWDESADLTTLAATPITIVCAGVKSILDIPATLERLETLNIALVGYRSNAFPGFYLSDSGYAVPHRVDSPDEVATIMADADALALKSALVVANGLPVEEQLDPALHDAVLADGLRAAADAQVTGKDVTPFLLAHFHRATDGASLTVNERIILRNAALAAQIAVASAR